MTFYRKELAMFASNNNDPLLDDYYEGDDDLIDEGGYYDPADEDYGYDDDGDLPFDEDDYA